jgi:hypothetical protein
MVDIEPMGFGTRWWWSFDPHRRDRREPVVTVDGPRAVFTTSRDTAGDLETSDGAHVNGRARQESKIMRSFADVRRESPTDRDA